MSRSDVLVDADWAEAHIGDPNVVIVEVDEDTSAYDRGHIPGAIKIDWKKDLQDPVRRDFVDKTGFEALLSERGISNDDTVLLYGGNNNWFAAYAYWYFRLYGHDKVLLLDGGRKKWELDSRELSTDVPERPRTSYTAPSRTPRCARCAMRCSTRSASATWSTSVPRTNSPAGCSPRPTSRRSRLSGPATFPPRATCPGPRRPTRTARSGPTTSSAAVPGRGRAGLRQGHHRLLPDRRALRAHLVRAARTARPAQRQELRRLVDRVRLAGRGADRAG